MALTADQDLPTKPQEKAEWTFKRIFSPAALSVLAKVFVNPFDIILGFLVVVISIAEMTDKDLSHFFWVLTAGVLVVSAAERHIERGMKAHEAEIKK